jgi:FkbM family methyltransferase
MRRVFAWQLASRLMRVPLVIPFTSNTSLVMEAGMTGATGNYYCGLDEFEDMAFVLHLLRPNDLFVDVGANVGSYTILASGTSRARTIAVEPLPATFARLRRNVRYNDLDDLVLLYNSGIGDSETTLKFTSTLGTVNHVVAEAETEIDSVEVPVLPMDKLLDDYQPLCIKIDVEGYEQKVIDGAASTLRKQSLRAVLMELNGSGMRYGYSDDAIHSIMMEYGFLPFIYEPFQRALHQLPNRNTKSGNTLYLRDIDFVRERLSSAAEIKLPWRDVARPQ